MFKDNTISTRINRSQSATAHSITTLRAYKLAGSEAEDVLLIELVETLLKIDVSSPLAKLNETTIDDNNGGRIEL